MRIAHTTLVRIVNEEEKAFKKFAMDKKKGYEEIRRALRIKNPTYIIVVQTTPDCGETRETATTHTGFLDDALEQADFDFNKVIGFETGSKRIHQVFLTAGNMKVQVPQTIYQDYLTKHHYTR